MRQDKGNLSRTHAVMFDDAVLLVGSPDEMLAERKPAEHKLQKIFSETTTECFYLCLQTLNLKTVNVHISSLF